MGDLTRRRMLQGLVAGATVVGWSSAERSWVTAAAASAGGRTDVAPVPPLDGSLETSPDTLAAFSGDFGHLVTATPQAVLRAGSVADVVAMVRYARRNRLTIAMNGQGSTAGPPESHSNFGQALTHGGIAIDARSLARIHHIGDAEADVDAGVTWAELTDAATAAGRTPPVLPDFLHLSIGGTLSVGGIGGTMQRFGATVDTVRELQVVTGRGNLVTCSRHERRDLFEAVLAGAGQVGIIVRASVALVPVEGRALIFNLFYDDLAAYLADQLRVMADGRFTYQEGQIVPRPDGSGWRYMIEAGVYYTPPAVPDQDALLAGLSDDRAGAVAIDLTYLEWVHRVDPLVVLLRGAGLWDLPHPWVSLFVPASRAAELAGQVTAQLTPDQLGAGLATFFPFPTAPLRRPLFVVPRPETRAFQLTLLRFPFPGADIPGLLAQNRAFHDLAVRLGGKRYIIGAVPDATTADWRRHYGALWPAFRVAKELYDPDAVLTPGQGIFA